MWTRGLGAVVLSAALMLGLVASAHAKQSTFFDETNDVAVGVGGPTVPRPLVKPVV